MSKIFQPPGAPFDFQYQDGVENLLFRSSPNVTTSSLSLATLLLVPIPANTWNTDGKNLDFIVLGNLAGVAGSKRIVAFIDLGLASQQIIFDSGSLAINNQNYSLRGNVFRLLTTNYHAHTHYFTYPFNSITVITSAGGVVQNNTFDPTIDHNFAIQALVTNAADNVSVIVCRGSFA